MNNKIAWIAVVFALGLPACQGEPKSENAKSENTVVGGAESAKASSAATKTPPKLPADKAPGSKAAQPAKEPAEVVKRAAFDSSDELKVTGKGEEPRVSLREGRGAPARKLMLSVEQYVARGKLAKAFPKTGLNLTIEWSPLEGGKRLAKVVEVVPIVNLQGANQQEKEIKTAIIGGLQAVEVTATPGAGGAWTFERTKGAETRPSIPSLLDMIQIPAPAEPVGPGASWSWSRGESETGEYELQEAGDTTAKLGVRRASRVVDSQTKSETEVTGEWIVGPRDGLPLSGALEGMARAQYQDQPSIDQKMAIRVQTPGNAGQ